MAHLLGVTVGGTLSGLAGTVVLRNNGKDDLTLTADGTFVFASGVTAGNPHAVTVARQPDGRPAPSARARAPRPIQR